jgi:hypothetical protein
MQGCQRIDDFPQHGKGTALLLKQLTNRSPIMARHTFQLQVAGCVLLAACCLLRFVRHASADHLNMFDGRIDE